MNLKYIQFTSIYCFPLQGRMDKKQEANLYLLRTEHTLLSIHRWIKADDPSAWKT